MNGAARVVRVWDVSIRFFHWLVVALVAAAYATWRLNWMVWHGWIGDLLLALLLFRLLWGFFGSETARFYHFLTSPRIAFQHLKYALLREPDRQVGHNPAGGWMVLFLLALLLAETLTGIYVANDIADVGPLTGIVPAAVANAIDVLPRDPLGCAVGGDRAARAGDLRLCGSQGSKPAVADDHWDKGPAGNRGRAAHGEPGAGSSPLRRQRRGCGHHRRAHVVPISSWEGSPDRGSPPPDGTACAR